jgi:hypothetical protein
MEQASQSLSWHIRYNLGMNRTVPRATSDEIQLYRSTLYSLLRSTAEVKVRTLEETHAGMNSLMHPRARDTIPDISAFIYSAMRLPGCIQDVRVVVLGQNSGVFRRNGFPNIEDWQPVSARARRRRCFFDGKDTLGCYIASRSDIEDVVPSLTAYQMEWNKMHFLFRQWPKKVDLSEIDQNPLVWQLLSETLRVPPDDLERLRTIWRGSFLFTLQNIRDKELSISVRLLSGSLAQYMRATHEWFENIKTFCPELTDRPVYFVSSNTHSIPNILTGFAQQHESELVEFIRQSEDADLQAEWETIQAGQVRASRENFLYYVLKKYQNTPRGAALIDAQIEDEKNHGILRIASEHTFDVEAQVIELRRLDPQLIDQRLVNGVDLSCLAESNALLINIDYPLGLAAFNILSIISIHTDLRGVYTMGKSASLNAARGDVIVPNVCQDEHSHNTYFFENCFTATDVAPYLKYGTVLDNQKAICVLGTFLQNAHLMDVFFSEGFGDIEMELGNVCSALYEISRPKRYPNDEIVNLYSLPVDFGALHYVSDTPMSKGKNLGAGTLSYYGMDSTYACSVAIIKRIFQQESVASQ